MRPWGRCVGSGEFVALPSARRGRVTWRSAFLSLLPTPATGKRLLFVCRVSRSRKIREKIFTEKVSESRFLSVVRENEGVTESPLTAAQRLFTQAVDALRGVAAAGSRRAGVGAAVCEAVVRRLDQVTVATVAGLDRDGRVRRAGLQVAGAGVERSVGLGAVRGPPPGDRRGAGDAADRVGRSGAAARLAATAEVFAQGRTGLRHVEVIARLLGSKAAGRLRPQQWAGAEAQLAAQGRRLHPDRAARVGHGVGGAAGSGRRATRRPAAGRW